MGRAKREQAPPGSVQEALQPLTLETLKPLTQLVLGTAMTRKSEIVPALARALLDPARLRVLYSKLDEVGRNAVREAAHDPRGRLDIEAFRAKYGQPPIFFEEDRSDARNHWVWVGRDHPTPLLAFLPRENSVPAEMRPLLQQIVPPPAPFTLPTLPEAPAHVERVKEEWRGRQRHRRTEQVPLRVRQTEAEALQDIHAVLRLVDGGQARVSDKTSRPSAATRQEVARVLLGGDFYTAEDEEKIDFDPAHDLTIKAFAWPILVQAGGLASPGKGTKLELTDAGRKALSRPPHEVIRAVWKKWPTSEVLDEFNRIDAIKGQKKANLSSERQRRKVVLDALAACPPGAWFAVEDFFRLMRATGHNFKLVEDLWDLYLVDSEYGSLGYDNEHAWEQMQGRYVLAVLFEYVATLGVIDVAYTVPQGARDDFSSRWGTDDYSCLSRYDGLLYLRINALGAWCLGLADTYQAPARPAGLLQVLPNLDVVVRQPPLPAADRLLLERYAVVQSEHVWHLDRERSLDWLEGGGALDDLEQLLAGAEPELPNTVQAFLDDVRHRAGRLTDRGSVRLFECASAELARELAADPSLHGKVFPAGERGLAFAAGDESPVRKALRRLGYVVPPARL